MELTKAVQSDMPSLGSKGSSFPTSPPSLCPLPWPEDGQTWLPWHNQGRGREVGEQQGDHSLAPARSSSACLDTQHCYLLDQRYLRERRPCRQALVGRGWEAARGHLLRAQMTWGHCHPLAVLQLPRKACAPCSTPPPRGSLTQPWALCAFSPWLLRVPGKCIHVTGSRHNPPEEQM